MEENVIEYDECYIAFLDLLGFKKRIEKKSCAEILKIYDEMKVPLKQIMHKGKCLMEEGDVKAKVMSDSICFYVNTQKPNALFALVSVCMMFQINLAKREEPILVRGGIVKGGIYAQNDVMFGSGLTNAYLLEEKSAIYPRIIMLKQVVDELLLRVEEYGQGLIEKMVIADMDGFYIVNYLYFMKQWGKNEEIERLYNYSELILASEYDSSVREKYLYLKNKLNLIK